MEKTRRKTFLPCLSLMLLAALLQAGCTGQTRLQDPGAPISVRLKDPVDLGTVEIVQYLFTTMDKKRSEEMMTLISQQILQQRNISMQLQITYIMNELPDAYIRRQAAAGKPPHMAQSPDYGRGKNMPAPLRLNEAIEQFGPNLKSQIPTDEWKNWTVGDSIAAVPLMVEKISPCVYAKGSLLESYGWKVPTTEQEFESLLQAAKDAGLCPIGSLPGKWPTQWFGFGRNDRAWLGNDGKVHPLEDSPEYNTYLDTLRRWHDAGYYSTGDKDTRTFLFSLDMDSLYRDTDAVPLPVISMAGIQPAAATTVRSFMGYESYGKPEALVTLLDWTYADRKNHTLISKGVEGTDWFAVGENGYVWEMSPDSTPYRGPKWGFQFDFAMDGFGGRPIFGCANPEGAKQARIYAQAAEKPSRFLSIDSVCKFYSLPDTTLREVTDPDSVLTLYAAQPSQTPAGKYTSGMITRADYDKELADRLAQPDPYLDLLQRILDKTYDPLQDMERPANATSEPID